MSATPKPPVVPGARGARSLSRLVQWKREDLLHWLKNARRRYRYWNEGCRRTGARAHEKKELYSNDVDRLEQLLGGKSDPDRQQRGNP